MMTSRVTASQICSFGDASLVSKIVNPLDACQACPAGKTSKSGSTLALNCTACPAGFYCPGAGVLHTGNRTIWSRNVIPCAPGKYGISEGQIKETEACQNCLPGSFGSTKGQIGNQSCIACPKKSIAPHKGTSKCKRCPIFLDSTDGGITCNDDTLAPTLVFVVINWEETGNFLHGNLKGHYVALYDRLVYKGKNDEFYLLLLSVVTRLVFLVIVVSVSLIAIVFYILFLVFFINMKISFIRTAMSIFLHNTPDDCDYEEKERVHKVANSSLFTEVIFESGPEIAIVIFNELAKPNASDRWNTITTLTLATSVWSFCSSIYPILRHIWMSRSCIGGLKAPRFESDGVELTKTNRYRASDGNESDSMRVIICCYRRVIY